MLCCALQVSDVLCCFDACVIHVRSCADDERALGHLVCVCASLKHCNSFALLRVLCLRELCFAYYAARYFTLSESATRHFPDPH